MEDMTAKLNEYKSKKDAETENLRIEKEQDFKSLLAKIESYASTFDMWIKNYNAALDAGIHFSDDTYSKQNFNANGITHNLGFLRVGPNNDRAIGLAVIGGGANGPVSIIYKDGKVFYSNDAYYGHDEEYANRHPITSFDDRILRNYLFAANSFFSGITPFEERLTEYLNKCLSRYN